MKKYYALILLFIVTGLNLVIAQELPRSGRIIYEKSVNRFAFIERDVINSNFLDWKVKEFTRVKESESQFILFNAELQFTSQQTLYKPLPDKHKPEENFWAGTKVDYQRNEVYTDLENGSTQVSKMIISEDFLIKDAIRPITWKLTDQTREIAGYTCRRANGLILDSVYVVAFFTSDIPVSAGPESFNGLPGMILGVALPHLNVTWFAKEVYFEPVAPLKAPTKGKPQTFDSLLKLIDRHYYRNSIKDFKLLMDYL